MSYSDYKIIERNNHKKKETKIIVLTRVRNEEDIIDDFLEHVSTFSDGVIAFDDCSQDKTRFILENSSSVLSVIANCSWEPNNRTGQETVHRRCLDKYARDKYNPMWLVYMDADERLEGDIREQLLQFDNSQIDFIRIPLFDAYLTPDDYLGIRKKDKLINSRKYFGPERRDIIFIWSSLVETRFEKDDSREPEIDSDNFLTMFRCQHFGKALSLQRWEKKCDYYANNFPEIYREKWLKRKGRGIHTLSDFGTPLYQWGDELFRNAIVIHPQ
ncbi:conserved hypothetical protein [Vibrio nigripulchritudo SFn27]|nr:glycosyltransferase family 2 protein [Vibrio nigripulchritudo]CCN81683.1 conserved hypothetical protein [Vibrio nigripulchritudo BLFn1]CCN91534.1 conserved hypothetical protein [Vibrio nigripulchritudo SFn27]CCN95675.1 conserved hypothetical protein [Vibrio nigripulchritudo ENn2]CCO39486.1 conserved hypothetical protein [Vibrio nigripulchritudo SFn135]CCO51170.1 conserved hypothetical protein [Vibrio nigripulchritudo Wn13]